MYAVLTFVAGCCLSGENREWTHAVRKNFCLKLQMISEFIVASINQCLCEPTKCSVSVIKPTCNGNQVTCNAVRLR